MKRHLTGLLNTGLIVGLFFASSTTLLAAPINEDPYEGAIWVSEDDDVDTETTVNTRNPFEKVEAEDLDIGHYFSRGYNIYTQSTGATIYNTGTIGFARLDFGDGADVINVYGQTRIPYTTLQIMIDNSKNPPLAEYEFVPDEDPTGMILTLNRIKLSEPITGVHDVFFAVVGEHSESAISIDYWYAEKDSTPEPTPEVKEDLTLEYDTYCWGSGYKVDFKVVNNTDTDIKGWALKLKKNGHIVDHSWCVNVEEDGDYYIVTPLDWNSIVPANGSVEFGFLGRDGDGAVEYSFIEPTPVERKDLSLNYDIQSWGTGYNVVFNLTNNSDTQLNGWTLKLNKNDINIDSSWGVNVEENDDFYVLTPQNWNAIIGPNGSTTFGIQGTGSIDYSSIGYLLNR